MGKNTFILSIGNCIMPVSYKPHHPRFRTLHLDFMWRKHFVPKRPKQPDRRQPPRLAWSFRSSSLPHGQGRISFATPPGRASLSSLPSSASLSPTATPPCASCYIVFVLLLCHYQPMTNYNLKPPSTFSSLEIMEKKAARKKRLEEVRARRAEIYKRFRKRLEQR